MPDVSVVTLNYKVKDLLKRSLASVYKYTKGVTFEVFVADNDSQDGSIEMVHKEFPEASLVLNKQNLGFAAGNNPAIQSTSGTFVLLLNPDTELQEDSITAMYNFMVSHPAAGICGSRLEGMDGKHQRSVRKFPSVSALALIMLKLHNVFPNLKPLREYFADDFDYTKSASVDQVMGAVFMIRHDVLEDIGLLDERFFIWYEEVDFCKRAKEVGYEVWYFADTTVRHAGGESFGQVFGPKKQGYLNASIRKYVHKHFGILPAMLIALLQPLSMALAWGAAGLKSSKLLRGVVSFLKRNKESRQ